MIGKYLSYYEEAFMIKKLALTLAACMMIFSMTACSGSGNNQNGNETTSPTTEQPTASTEATVSEPVTPTYDPLGKYDEAIEVTAVLPYAAKTDPKIPEEVTPETQAFVKMAKEYLNIDIKFLWIAPANQYEQKFGVSMASGELPDIIKVNPTNFHTLKENEQLADLTDTYNNYASGLFKEYAEKDPTTLKFGSFDGKMYGIPRYSDVRRNMNLMFIRQDWLDTLGLSIPKTVDELKNVAIAFAKNDPDGNSKDDTVAFGLSKDVLSWGFDIGAVMNSFGSYPMKWTKGADGKLVPGEIQPQTKTALEYLSVLYKEGALDKEFVLKDADKISEELIAGKAGIAYGPWWLYEWPLNMNKDNQKDANWVSVQIPGMTEGTGKSIVNRADIYEFYAVNSACKNPEAVIKLFNLYCDSSVNTEKYGTLVLPEGGNVWNWVPTIYGNPFDIEAANERFNKALNDEEFAAKEFTEEELKSLGYYKDYNAFIAGNGTWDGANFGGIMARLTPDGGWGVTQKVFESGNIEYNEFGGTVTATQQEKGASLDKMTAEIFLKIITGDSPISDFDTYVENWKKLGGDQITIEVNEWYEVNKK